jgi:putative transposase
MLCRRRYHTALEQRTTAYERRSVSLSRDGHEAELKDMRADLPEYAAMHSQVLQDVLARLETAFQAFFRRSRAGQTPGSPRVHGRTRSTSLTSKEFGNGARLANGCLVLSQSGRSAVRWSRPLEGTAKTVTISREADGWSVGVSWTDVPLHPLPATGHETGIDLGLEAVATTSDGTCIVHPGWYRQAERRLKTAQRRVSRRQKGSHRRRKAVALLSRAHLKVKRHRADFHDTTALRFVQANDPIDHDEVQTATMLKHHPLAKSISDAGWSVFVSILSAKAAWAGRRVVAVPPAYTSQTCSGCGARVHTGLSLRWHRCPDCGTRLHRDHTAAKNRARAGLALRAGAAVAAS